MGELRFFRRDVPIQSVRICKRDVMDLLNENVCHFVYEGLSSLSYWINVNEYVLFLRCSYTTLCIYVMFKWCVDYLQRVISGIKWKCKKLVSGSCKRVKKISNGSTDTVNGGRRKERGERFFLGFPVCLNTLFVGMEWRKKNTYT